MKIKLSAFPILNSLPNPDGSKTETTPQWNSFGEKMISTIPMNSMGEFEGVLQTFSNGRLLEERQYHKNRAWGASVFYAADGSIMSIRVLGDDGEIARTRIL